MDILLICIALFQIFGNIPSTSSEAIEICNTKQCKNEAEKISNTINWKIDPCQDFYEFSCGNWEQINRPVIDKLTNPGGQMDTHQVAEFEFGKKLGAILFDNFTGYPNIVHTMKTYFNSCITLPLKETDNEFEIFITSYINGLSAKELIYEFITLTIDWTIYPRQRVELDQIKLNMPDFEHNITETFLNASQEVLEFLELKNSTNEKKLKKVFIGIHMKRLYENMSFEYNDERINQIMELEDEIQEIFDNSAERKLEATIESLNHSISEKLIDWEGYFQNEFKDADVDINWKTQKIIIENEIHLKNLLELLGKKDAQIIRLFLLWHYAFHYGPMVSLELQASLSDITPNDDRIKECFTNMLDNFELAMVNPYAKKHFPPEDIKKARNITDSILEAFKRKVLNIPGFSTHQRKEMVKKSESLTSLIAYPEWILNNTALEQYYKGMNFSKPRLYFMNNLEAKKWTRIKSLGRLNSKMDKREWLGLLTPLDMEFTLAYSFVYYNLIVITLGYLGQSFGKSVDALNYGALGWTFGHEIMHMYHTEFDSTCLIDQYSKYQDPVTSLKINGSLTFEENLGDNWGLKLAYEAFTKFGKKERLPGELKKITPEQLIFLSFAQNFCSVYSPERLKEVLISGEHAPKFFRIRGAIENSLEFAKAWKCPNIVPKCNIFKINQKSIFG